MLELTNTQLAKTYGLETTLKSQMIIDSVGTGGYGSIVRLPDGTSQEDQDTATAIQAGHNTLSVAATKTTIDADAIDETAIECATIGMVFDYKFWRDGALVASGNITDGTLEYSTNTPGTLLFEVKNPANWETGYIEVIAL